MLEFLRLKHNVFTTSNAPKNGITKDLVENFQLAGNVKDEYDENIERQCTATTRGNTQLVQHVIKQWPRGSILRVASAVQMKSMPMSRLMRHSLFLYPYKILTRQPFSAASIITRETLANDMVQRIDDGDIHEGRI